MSIFVTILFMFAPFISIPFIIFGIVFDKKHSLIYAILLALLFAIIAYNFNPTDIQDLYRYYFEMKDFYSHISFNRYMQDAFHNTKIIFKFMQFLCAQSGNYNLLPFIFTFIGYTISFYIILDYSKLKNINKFITLFVLIVFVCTFYHINFMSGLAQYLAMSISFLAFYLEFIKNKKGIFYKALYIIPIFIHISLVILLAFRLFLIFDFKKTKIYYIIFIIIYAFVPTIIYYILNMFPSMQMIAQKINNYMLQGNKELSRII